jgi:glucosamine-6-phosphate deaminase
MMDNFPAIDIRASSEAVAERAAGLVIDDLASGRIATLGLATGATMLPVYAQLVAAYTAGAVSFKTVTSFNLDEYMGVQPSARGSFRAFMQRCLFDRVDIDPARIHVPDGLARDSAIECARYENLIKQNGGIDLQLLGIGANGHIGFNEPGSPFTSRTREIVLTGATRAANAAFFGAPAEVPLRALTMGIGTILEAREILLVATGAHKADAVNAALFGPISTACPASALRLHPRVRIICDAAAATHIAGRRAASTGRDT